MMKKFLFTLAAAFVTLTASAQVYVGGEVGFWRNWADGANETTFKVLPEVIRKLNKISPYQRELKVLEEKFKAK